MSEYFTEYTIFSDEMLLSAKSASVASVRGEHRCAGYRPRRIHRIKRLFIAVRNQLRERKCLEGRFQEVVKEDACDKSGEARKPKNRVALPQKAKINPPIIESRHLGPFTPTGLREERRGGYRIVSECRHTCLN